MIDWDRATAEATELLRQYIRIDTSNPPGNEAHAVEFLGSVLESSGIPFEVAESGPGRANLRAAIGPPVEVVCLLSHTDVVPVERRFWKVDPFAGELRDGAVWGRGALDMKGMGVLELMTLLLLKREKVPLRRGLAFLAVADEEAASEYGVSWLATHRPDWLACDLVINEGAYGLLAPEGEKTPPLFQVAIAEKTPVWVRLTAEGRPGHGSVPHPDNCAERLVRALDRVGRWKQQLRLVPAMEAHVGALASAGLVGADEGVELLAARGPGMAARLAHTIALTTVATGIKVNVIPAEATATLDCRLLPDVDPDHFLEELRGVIGDSRVRVEPINRSYRGKSESFDHQFVATVRDVVRTFIEESRVVPEMTSGFTDSRIFRSRGVPSFGFIPCLVNPAELAGIHGHNERIGVENLRLGMQILFEVVRRLCAE